MNELHITDTSTNGTTIHARQYDSETGWTVEVAGNPKLSKALLATDAEQQQGYDSTVVHATTEQLIMFLATAAGYRVKLQKRQKRQYSPEHRAALAERLRNLNPTRNAILVDVSAQDSTFLRDMAHCP